MKLSKILGTLTLFFGILLILMAIGYVHDYSNDKEIKIVDCYDINNNKMIGQQCEEESSDKLSLGVLCFIIGGIVIACSTLIYSGDY